MHELVIDGTPSGQRRDFGADTPPDFTGHPAKGGWTWLPFQRIEATLGADEVTDGVTKAIESGVVVERVTKRAMTNAEKTARDRNRLAAATADNTVLLVRLIQMLASPELSVIAATDFRPAVRQAYQDALAIANRLDPPP